MTSSRTATAFWHAVVNGSTQELTVQLTGRDAALLVTTGSPDGHFALELAAFWGHLDVMKLLIAQGADIDAQSPVNGATALHSAAVQNHGRIMKYLLLDESLRPNASMSILDRQGRTAADLASSSEVLWSIVKAAGYTGARKSRAELQSLGVPDDSQHDVDSTMPPPIMLGERPAGPAMTEQDYVRARSFGDVLLDDGEE